MANSALLLLNHVYLLTYNPLGTPSIQLCLRLSYVWDTCRGEETVLWANEWQTFFSPDNIHLTQIVCPSTAIQWAYVFPLRGMCIITCLPHISENVQTCFPDSNKHARDLCTVVWQLSLGRWVTESKFGPVPPPPPRKLCNHTPREIESSAITRGTARNMYQGHRWVGGRSKHPTASIISFSRNLTSTLKLSLNIGN